MPLEEISDEAGAHLQQVSTSLTRGTKASRSEMHPVCPCFLKSQKLLGFCIPGSIDVKQSPPVGVGETPSVSPQPPAH